jgi:hypothetical protein
MPNPSGQFQFTAASMILVFLFSCAAVRGSEAGSPAVPFAMIPPEVLAHLPEQNAAKEAGPIIHAADAGLTQAPRALPRVHTEGTLPHQGIWDQSVEAAKDWPLMLDLGLAYRLTGDHRYLDAENRFLTAWLELYKVSFNPIDETGIDQIIFAYDLTGPDLPESTREKMAGFLRDIAGGYLDRIDQQIINHREDRANWQSHRIKLIVLASYALGDDALIGRAGKAFQRQVSVNIHPDGSVEDFFKRDALHYVTYDLEPLGISALAAREHHRDWFHGPGPSVALAVDWLVPFALGQKTHREFVHSSVKFDAIRAAAGLKGYSGLWDPAHSVYLLGIASALDPRFEPVLETVIRNTGHRPPDWLSLLVKAGL